MWKGMEMNKLLYLCDLNIKNGGAQRITYKTLGCLSKAFNILLYITEEPSSESLSLLNELRLEYVLDREFDTERLKNVIITKGIDMVLVQFENPEWIINVYKIKKSVGIKYAIFLHELPYIGTPTNKFIRNWYVLASLHYMRDAFISLLRMKKEGYLSKLYSHKSKNVSAGQESAKEIRLNSISVFIQLLNRVTDTYRGLKEAENIIAMGPASKFYIDHFLRLSNVLEIEHNASSDISSSSDIKNVTFNYDICFMAARLDPRKGIFDVLKVVNRVKNIVDYDPKVVILGRFVEEETREAFIRKVKKLNLESNIYLLGFVSENEKLEILSSSKVFLYPSKKDVFSISLADALSIGLPAVVYDMPFTMQFCQQGISKVRLGNTSIMARRVAEILNLCNFDPGKYIEMRRSIRENFLKKFSWDITCMEQISIINFLIANLHDQ